MRTANATALRFALIVLRCLCSFFNALVQVFDTNGKYLREFDGFVESDRFAFVPLCRVAVAVRAHALYQGFDRLYQPYAVSCDSALNWAVADHGHDRVAFFTREGAFITAFGDRGQLYSPTGVHVDEDNRIWVGDALGVQMYVFPSS